MQNTFDNVIHAVTLLGGTTDHDTMSGFLRAIHVATIEVEDEESKLRFPLRLWFEGNKVSAYVMHPTERGITRSVKKIGLSFTRDPQTLAKEIKRRIYPDAIRFGAGYHARWIAEAQRTSSLTVLKDQFEKLPHVRRCDLERDGQRLKVSFSHHDRGRLDAEIYPDQHGTMQVSIDRSWFQGPDQLDRLKAVAAALFA